MSDIRTRSRTKVLVVDDSRVAREYLGYVLGADARIEVVGEVATGEDAVAFVRRSRPDIVLMDLHLPGIDGFEATRQIMATAPVPIIVCTAGTSFHEVKTAMEALAAGALAALRKPVGPTHPDAAADAAALISMLRVMAQVRVVRRWQRPAAGAVPAQRPARIEPAAVALRSVAVVAIGASTGGPPALAAIMSRLPKDFGAPVLIVQHITSGFTAGFASWLGTETGRPVHVVSGGEMPLAGHVYVAGEGGHLRVSSAGRLEMASDEPPSVHCPSVGVLFTSVAQRYGRRAIGVLLTGMGRDGAAELKVLADAGALTVAQDEASCVVFGMPGEAIRLGGAQLVLSPQAIADLLVRVVRVRSSGT